MAHLKAVTQTCETPEVLSSTLPTCSFGEMAPLFFELFASDLNRITAILARMKDFQRQGLLGRAKVRGRQNSYTPADLWRLLVAMELCHIGLSTRWATAILNESEIDRFFGETGLAMIPLGDHGSMIAIDMAHLRDAARKHLPHMFTGGVS